MTKKYLINTFFLMNFCLIVGCSSNPKKHLLPDGGPTTAEIYSGSAVIGSENSNVIAGPAPYIGQPFLTTNSSMSTRSIDHIDELKMDFKRVPNPEVVGYVFPHFNQADMPVPGYFTIFKIYEKEHYARTGEGYYAE